MMTWLNRILAWLMVALLGLVLITLLYYAFIVHPDDTRIASGPVVQSTISRQSSVGSLMTSNWVHAVTPVEGYAEAKAAFIAAQPYVAISSSKRFKSPYQIFVAAGEYPLRLEAHDGLYLPDGATLTIGHGRKGAHAVAFAAYADGVAGKVTLHANPSDLVGQNFAVAQPTAKVAERGFIYKQLTKFLKPDRVAELRRWHRVSADVALDGSLAISCHDAPLGCVIGDVSLSTKTPPIQRNVLMIVVDTMRGDATAGSHMPQLSAFEAQGTTFTTALAPGNMTSPSTNALLSCRTASDLGAMAFAYAVNEKHREGFYTKREPSFPYFFRQAGYRTAMIGNVSVLSEVYGVGVNHGFSEQIAIESEAYDTPLIARETAAWLTSQGQTPFFLYVHLHGPHAPYRAPWQDLGATYPGIKALTGYPSALRWLYQSELHYTDRYLAKIFDALDRLGLADTTDVVITADHGDMHTSHRFFGNEVAPSFAGAYFDHGATLLNDEIRVPMVFRGAGIEAGKRVDGIVSTLDIGPTLMQRAGLTVPAFCTGSSMSEALSGAPLAPLRAGMVVGSEAFQGRAVIFDQRYKYVRMYAPVEKRVYQEGVYFAERHQFMRKHQLYDLQLDPDEERQVTDPALLARAERIYREYFDIKDLYEVVVESPDAQAIEVRIPAGWTAKVVAGPGDVSNHSGEQLVLATGVKRLVIELRSSQSSQNSRPGSPPRVHIAGAPTPLTQTTMRLPLLVPLEELPIESGGVETLLPATGQANAYIRRIDDDGQRDRRISVGNPAFDKILREWGYLND